jgi:general secretion pathway protein C
MMARLSAFVIWALVAAAAVFWGMRLLAKGEPVPSHAVVVSESTNVRGDFSRLLGAEPVAAVAAPPAASTRFKLLGVMAAKAGPQGTVTPGVALISIDGKPARAFTSGAQIEDRLVLQNVSLRSASIGAPQGPVAFVLEVPPLPAPATGTLPRFTPDVPQPSAPQAPAFNPPPVPATSQRPVPPAGNGAAPPGPRNVMPGARQARPGVGNPEAAR